MGHSRVRLKVRRRKVAHLAARSRQFTVNNSTVPKTKLNQSNYFFSWDKRTQFGKFEINTFGHLFTIDKDGHYHLIERKFDPTPLLLDHTQPKSLRKKYKKKYYNKGSHEVRKTIEHPSTFPTVTCKKMTQQEYWEKLVEHKLERWERKNPKPSEMFTEDVEKWKQQRETAKERFRDFVVSTYDKLSLTGRFKMNREGSTTYQEEEVAKIKDINGEGHKVNDLPKDSKLLKKAQKITNEIKAKRANLVRTNLRDHKRKRGRIILPQAA